MNNPTDQEVADAYRSGLSQHEVAVRLGIGRDRVRRALKRSKVTTRTPMRTVPPGAISDYMSGMSIVKVARKYEANPQTVTKWLRRYDIPIRRPTIPHGDDLLELVGCGMTPEQIAEDHNVRVKTVIDAIRDAKAGAVKAKRVEAPAPRARRSEWKDRAACKGADTEIFYTEPGTTAADIERAKAYCRVCPVVVECLEDAIALGDEWAVLGNTTPRERKPAGRARVA